MTSERKQELHDKGQRDAVKNDYDRPHGFLNDLTTWSDHGMKTMNEENTAYDAGWKNGDKTKK